MTFGTMLKRVFLATALFAGMVTVSSTPAAAASGGGCSDNPVTFGRIQTCISYSGSARTLRPDFYVPSLTASGWCYVSHITDRSGRHLVANGAINHTGRYGPWPVAASRFSSPARHTVDLWRCSGSAVTVISPLQYWP